jgi:expansin (peptidoglycan-binding protein)
MDSGAWMIQGKTLFKPLATNTYGVGLAAGYATQPGDGQSGGALFLCPDQHFVGR